MPQCERHLSWRGGCARAGNRQFVPGKGPAWTPRLANQPRQVTRNPLRSGVPESLLRDDPVPRLLFAAGCRDPSAPRRILKLAGVGAAMRQSLAHNGRRIARAIYP